MDRVRKEIGRKPTKASKAAKPAAPPDESHDQAAEDRRLAEVIGRSVFNAAEPVASLHERLHMPDDDRLSRAIEVAKTAGWITESEAGYVVGPTRLGPMPVKDRRPSIERAGDLGRIVHASTQAKTLGQLAGELGMSKTGSINRAVSLAKERGWIVRAPGKSGFLRGPEAPPPAPEKPAEETS